MTAPIDSITGRYVYFDIEGRPHRVYFEESGAGIPLICLHTAGSDATQFRHLLTDVEIAKQFRVIAFDMPWHGKSLPPVGYHNEEYRLTTDLYDATISAFCDALDLDRHLTRRRLILAHTRSTHRCVFVAIGFGRHLRETIT